MASGEGTSKGFGADTNSQCGIAKLEILVVTIIAQLPATICYTTFYPALQYLLDVPPVRKARLSLRNSVR